MQYKSTTSFLDQPAGTVFRKIRENYGEFYSDYYSPVEAPYPQLSPEQVEEHPEWFELIDPSPPEQPMLDADKFWHTVKVFT